MMGRQCGDQASLFYEFRLEDRIPKDHLLRRINVFVTPVLDDMREQLQPYYSEIGRPSIDPELMLRMLIIGYCYGLRSERKLTQEVELHLAYRWFCRLDLDDKVPHHSTFSQVGRLGALENAADIDALLPIHVHNIGSVAHQSADFADVARAGRHRQRMARRPIRELEAPAIEK